jgi:hypothetical protein
MLKISSKDESIWTESASLSITVTMATNGNSNWQTYTYLLSPVNRVVGEWGLFVSVNRHLSKTYKTIFVCNLF